MKAIDPETGPPIRGQEPTVDPPPPPVNVERPKVIIGAPQKQPSETVDPDWAVDRAAEQLPSQADWVAYLTWRRTSPTELREWVDEIIQAANVDGGFANNMAQVCQEFATTRSALDTVAPPAAGQGRQIDPLPGVDPASLCRSMIDPSLLRLDSRKAVFEKGYRQLSVVEDAAVVPLPTASDVKPRWQLGQRFEYLQEWRHNGFILGSLISSLSLVPGETQIVEESSWLRTKLDTEQQRTDTSEQASDYENRRTDEQACIDQATDSSGWNVSASGNLDALGVPVSIGGGYNNSSATVTQNTHRHVTEETSKATSKLSSTRSTKVVVTTEAGSESKTTRTLTNPNALHTLTYNFFDVIRLIDLRIRLVNDAPVVLIAGLFPPTFTDGKPMRVPFGVIEALNSPANFITQYFEVDHDLSSSIWGFALRIRSDPCDGDAMQSLRQIAEALVIAARFLFKRDDPDVYKQEIAAFVSAYASRTLEARRASLAFYSTQHLEQVTTPGIYIDAVVGTCSAGEDYVESQRYTAALRADAERRLVVAEVERREHRIAANDLDSFEPCCAQPSPAGSNP